MDPNSTDIGPYSPSALGKTFPYYYFKKYLNFSLMSEVEKFNYKKFA